MKLSRSVLAALLALPLAGVALAADDAAGQAGIERLPPGAEAVSPEAAAPMPGDAPAAAPGAAAGQPVEPSAGRAAPADAGSAAAGDAAQQKADAMEEGGAESGKDAGPAATGEGDAAAEKDSHEATGEHALGEKQAAPMQDDDPALDRAREPAAPPASAEEEPASSRI